MGTYATRHEVDDWVYFLTPHHKAKQAQVTLLNLQVNRDAQGNLVQTVQYQVDGQYVMEDTIFPSLKELLDHVQGDLT